MSNEYKSQFEDEKVEGKTLSVVLDAKEELARKAEAEGNSSLANKLNMFVTTVRGRISRVNGVGINIEPEMKGDMAANLGGVAYLKENRTDMNARLVSFSSQETDESVINKALNTAAVCIHEMLHHLMHSLGVVCSEKTHEGLTQAATEAIDPDASVTGAYRSEVAHAHSKTSIASFRDALLARDAVKAQQAATDVEEKAA